MVNLKNAGDVIDEIECIQKTIAVLCGMLNDDDLGNEDADAVGNATCLLANYRETLRTLPLRTEVRT